MGRYLRTMAAKIIIGGDGAIGRALVRELQWRGDVVWPTTRRAGAVNPGQQVDLSDPDISAARLPTADVAYFVAAVNGFVTARSHPEVARQVNVASPVKLARQLVDRGVRVVLVSSCAVFDFQQPRVR